MADEKSDAVAFVTRKVLVTFNPQVCIMTVEGAVYASALICEYDERDGDVNREVREFRVVGLPNGNKMTKTQHLHVCGFQHVVAMVEVD